MTALFLLLAIAAAVGAAIALSLGASPALAGVLATAAFVGLAGAAASAAVALRASDTLAEPRTPRGPSEPLPPAPEPLSRSIFGRLWFAAAGAFAILAVVPVVALSRKPGRRVPTGWQSGVRLVTAENRPVRPNDLDVGGIATVFPENGRELPDSAVVLVRVEPELLHMQNASSLALPGMVAYSKICTHAGCPVALYRHASHQLYCPCHQSLFDVLDGARNVSGPAPRPLPHLPLGVDAAGFLIASGDLSGPVGPDDWYRELS